MTARKLKLLSVVRRLRSDMEIGLPVKRTTVIPTKHPVPPGKEEPRIVPGPAKQPEPARVPEKV
jgi:hypothetical protein